MCHLQLDEVWRTFLEKDARSPLFHGISFMIIHDSCEPCYSCPWLLAWRFSMSGQHIQPLHMHGFPRRKRVVFWLVVLLQTPNFSATKVHQICNGEFMEWKNNTWNVHVCLKILHGYICTAAQFRSFRRIFGDFKPAT